MRIVAGSLGGRQFVSPRGHRTHPMSEKMRAALFNALGDLGGLTVLDPFAGSGAMSFEAVSRGADQSLAIEADPGAQRTVSENITSLQLSDKVKLIRASADAWLRTSDQQFDIVVCDPPYDKPQLELLAKLADRVKQGGLIIFSLPPNTVPALPAVFQEVAVKDYGDAQLRFYRLAER